MRRRANNWPAQENLDAHQRVGGRCRPGVGQDRPAGSRRWRGDALLIVLIAVALRSLLRSSGPGDDQSSRVSGGDMRGSAQSHLGRGHTVFDTAETSPPDFQERYFCTSFTSPSSTSSRGMDRSQHQVDIGEPRCRAACSVYAIRCHRCVSKPSNMP